MTGIENLWKPYSVMMQEGIDYLAARAKGEIRSLKTQWESFNKIGFNGIEWNSLYVLAARPGVGKTLISASLTRELQNLNKDQDFNVLHFQFEMLGRNMAIREFSAKTELDVRYIQSSEDDGLPPLKKEDLDKIKAYYSTQLDRKEFIIDKSLTVNEMKLQIIEFYKSTKKPFVVTLDHTLLIKQGPSEQNRQVTLQNLATMLTEMKNHLPVTFIVLTQLNREIDNAERQSTVGKLDGHYPTEADVYGSDFLLQCADVMVAYNRPAKYNLAKYGPNKYLITPSDKYLLAMHILKNRFGSTGIQWYKAEYKTMTIVEAPEPMKESKFK